MESDFQKTGRLYQKLDAFVVLQRPESLGVEIYLGSSCQFKTQKKYKEWLLAQSDFSRFVIKIKKGE